MRTSPFTIDYSSMTLIPPTGMEAITVKGNSRSDKIYFKIELRKTKCPWDLNEAIWEVTFKNPLKQKSSLIAEKLEPYEGEEDIIRLSVGIPSTFSRKVGYGEIELCAMNQYNEHWHVSPVKMKIAEYFQREPICPGDPHYDTLNQIYQMFAKYPDPEDLVTESIEMTVTTDEFGTIATFYQDGNSIGSIRIPNSTVEDGFIEMTPENLAKYNITLTVPETNEEAGADYVRATMTFTDESVVPERPLVVPANFPTLMNVVYGEQTATLSLLTSPMIVTITNNNGTWMIDTSMETAGLAAELGSTMHKTYVEQVSYLLNEELEPALRDNAEVIADNTRQHLDHRMLYCLTKTKDVPVVSEHEWVAERPETDIENSFLWGLMEHKVDAKATDERVPENVPFLIERWFDYASKLDVRRAEDIAYGDYPEITESILKTYGITGTFDWADSCLTIDFQPDTIRNAGKKFKIPYYIRKIKCRELDIDAMGTNSGVMAEHYLHSVYLDDSGMEHYPVEDTLSWTVDRVNENGYLIKLQAGEWNFYYAYIKQGMGGWHLYSYYGGRPTDLEGVRSEILDQKLGEVTGTVTKYLVSTEATGVTTSTDGWSTAYVEPQEGEYLWSYTTVNMKSPLKQKFIGPATNRTTSINTTPAIIAKGAAQGATTEDKLYLDFTNEDLEPYGLKVVEGGKIPKSKIPTKTLIFTEDWYDVNCPIRFKEPLDICLQMGEGEGIEPFGSVDVGAGQTMYIRNQSHQIVDGDYVEKITFDTYPTKLSYIKVNDGAWEQHEDDLAVMSEVHAYMDGFGEFLQEELAKAKGVLATPDQVGDSNVGASIMTALESGNMPTINVNGFYTPAVSVKYDRENGKLIVKYRDEEDTLQTLEFADRPK